MARDSDRPSPPRLWRALLELVIRPDVRREDIVGGLAEEFGDKIESVGRARAVRWYRRQAWGFVLREVWSKLTLRSSIDGGGGWGAAWIASDVRFALRSFWRSPAPYAVAVLTVALGVGANAVMFSVVDAVILSPLPYPDQDRLVSVWPEKRWSAPMLRDVRERARSFDRVGAGIASQATLLGVGDPEVLSAWQVTGEWFDVLGARPALGRLLIRSDEVAADGAVAVLSHDFWVTAFGADPAVLGTVVQLTGNGATQRTIVGVLEEEFAPFPQSADVWIPWITDASVEGFRPTYGGTAIGTLAPGTTEATAIAEMRSLIPELRNVHSTQFREVRFSPVDVVSLHEVLVRDVRTQLFVLLGAVAFVLLIACTNVANLLLARAIRRRREVGLRLALGASRTRILHQMLTESLVLGFAGGAAGVAVALIALPTVRSRLGEYLPRTELLALDFEVLVYAVVMSLLAGLLFGIAPGMRSARQGPGTILSAYARSSAVGRGAGRLNDALVVTEIALSLVLVVGAGLMLKSLQVLADVDPGFDPAGVVAMNLVIPTGAYDEPAERDALFTQLIDRIEAVPGVGAGNVAAVNSLPLEGGWSGIPYQVPGQEVPEGESVVGGFRLVSPEYFGLLGLEILDGRGLTEVDGPDSEIVAVVNASFVERHWPSESAIGKALLDGTGDEMATVVGVVSDTRFAGLNQAPVPSMYFPAAQVGWITSWLVIRPRVEDPLALIDPIRREIQAVDPNLPIREPGLLSTVVEEAVGDERFYTQLLGAFAGLALLLGLIGVYGVTSYAVGQRTHEVGIRVALGATDREVLTQTVRRGLLPVVAGVGFGLAGALAVSGVLQSLLYEVTASDPVVYGLVALLVLAAAGAATLVPALRTLRQDPAEVLKAEV